MKISNFFFFACLLLSACLSVVCAGLPLPNIPATQFSIVTYGAAHTSADNSTAINAAITAANAAGGGTVVIPADSFLSGPITMKSNVNLYLSAGAVLRMMPYGNGNGLPAGSYPNNGTTNTYNTFITGNALHNIEISGQGIIEGNGAAWWAAYTANSAIGRPGIIRFRACDTVLITGITLQNSPNVHVTLGQSSTMGSYGTISNITIIAPATSPNTDAIDLWYWKNVDILNCNLSEGDDNVAVNTMAQNVTVKHCTFGNGHGMSVGSYTGSVENIFVDSCTFTGTTNGIRLKTSRTRGGNDSSFYYSNITMTNVKYPFYITSWYPTEPYPASAQVDSPITVNTPVFKNITFKNIMVTNSTYAGIIYGLPESYIKNIVFDSVQITATTKGLVTNFVSGLVFKNCSSITIPATKGNAIISYAATIAGIDTATGISKDCHPAGVEALNTAHPVSCYPNPVNGNEVIITNNAAISKIQIYDLSGKKMIAQQGNMQKQLSVNVKDLPAGYYMVSVLSVDGRVASLKLVRE